MTATPQFRWQAVGRRKTSVARVYLTPGTGKWDINGRTLGDYFPAVVHGHRYSWRLRRQGARKRRRPGGAGRRLTACHRAGSGRGRWPASYQAPGCGPDDPGSPGCGAEETGTPGRPEAVPVQQALARLLKAGQRGRIAGPPARPLRTLRDLVVGAPAGVATGDERGGRITLNRIGSH
jgi:hypothetical protein